MNTTVFDNYKKLTNRLIELGLTISTCESCTSGQIASLITDTEGSSSVFKGAFVTYSNDAKIICGVDKEIINKFGVYSEETSLAMAKAAKEKFNTDLSVGITGTFGNVDTQNSDSVINQVFYSIIKGDKVLTKMASLSPVSSRREYKLEIADIIYEDLIKFLNETDR